MKSTSTGRTRLLTTEDLAEMTGVKPRTIERWREAGSGPPFMLFGRTIRYHPARVQAWMLAQEQGAPARGKGAPAKAGGGGGR